MEFLSQNVWIIWAAVLVVFLLVEAATVGLTSIWFAVGALAALVASLFGAPTWAQLMWFLGVSIAALCITRPLAKKFNSTHQPTNADMLIGMEGIVSEKIDNIAGTGAASVGGKIWTARSDDDEGQIEQKTKVVIRRIEGVKLIVSPAEDYNRKGEE